jgi:monoterpene epsilon-lactone hydrolase
LRPSCNDSERIENLAMNESAAAASAGPLYGMPGAVSWQARLLNSFLRHAIKRPIQDGIRPSSARFAIRLLEMITPGRGAARAHSVDIGGVPCEVVVPRHPAARGRVVLYLHGGGFFAHLPRRYRRFARMLADAMGATVYLPAYRLAPEHRFPAATDDCMAVFRKLLTDGCAPASMCVMGDSAGGNLALVLLLRARDEKVALPCCAIVLSPGADLTFSGASYAGNADADPLIPAKALVQLVPLYVDADKVAHPYVSPMLGDYVGLPPIRILVGSTEVLLDSSVTTAASARGAGVDVSLQVWRDMPHVFPIFSFLPEGRMAMRDMAGFFDRHAATPAPPSGDQ